MLRVPTQRVTGIHLCHISMFYFPVKPEILTSSNIPKLNSLMYRNEKIVCGQNRFVCPV